MGGVDISVRHLDKDNTAAHRCEIGASGWVDLSHTWDWSLLGDDRLHG